MDRRAGSVAFRAVSNFHQVFLKMFGIKICRKRKLVARKRQAHTACSFANWFGGEARSDAAGHAAGIGRFSFSGQPKQKEKKRRLLKAFLETDTAV